MAAKKKLSFEDQLNSLEAMILSLENGELSLEESLKKYEEGTKLLNELENEMKSAKQRLTILTETAEGNTELPLEVSNDAE